MRFSDPDMRELLRDPERFVRRRLADSSKGFNYIPRAWFEAAIAAYFENGRSASRAQEVFRALQPGRKGITDWKRQHAASMLRMLERFIETDQRDPIPTVALFQRRPRATPFYGHEMAVRMDLWCPGKTNILRVLWTDQRSRLGTKGTTSRVAALLAHGRAHVPEQIDGVEVWQLRYRQRLLWPARDLEPHLPRIRALMDWANDRYGRAASA